MVIDRDNIINLDYSEIIASFNDVMKSCFDKKPSLFLWLLQRLGTLFCQFGPLGQCGFAVSKAKLIGDGLICDKAVLDIEPGTQMSI